MKRLTVIIELQENENIKDIIRKIRGLIDSYEWITQDYINKKVTVLLTVDDTTDYNIIKEDLNRYGNKITLLNTEYDLPENKQKAVEELAKADALIVEDTTYFIDYYIERNGDYLISVNREEKRLNLFELLEKGVTFLKLVELHERE